MLDSFHTYPVFPDLLENQRRSIKFFWEKGILDELELFSTIIGYKKEKNGNRTLVQTNELKKKSGQFKIPEKKSTLADQHAGAKPSTAVLTNPKSIDPQNISFTKPTSVSVLLNKRIFNSFDSGGGTPPSIDKEIGNKESEIETELSSSIDSLAHLTKLTTKRKSGGRSPLRPYSLVSQNTNLPHTLSSFNLTAVEQLRTKIRTKLKTNQVFKEARGPKIEGGVPPPGTRVSNKTPALHSPNLLERATRKSSGPRIQRTTLDLNSGTKRTAQKKVSFPNKPVNGEVHSSILFAEKMEGLSFLNTQTLFSKISNDGRESLATSKPSSNGFSGEWGALPPSFNSQKANSISRNKRQILESAGFNFENRKVPLQSRGITQLQVPDEVSPPNVILSSTAPETEYLVLHGSKFLLKAPYYSQSEAIKFQKTYSVGLFLPVSRKKGNILKAVASSDPTAKDISPGERSSPQNFGPGTKPSTAGPSSKEFSQRDSKENKSLWFYFGDIPLMTDRGSFIINGAPRVLVNQIIRCPSVYFKVKLDPKNRRTYIASFLSEYGSWLRLETDRLSNRLWARIDKSPRFPADLLLMGLGYNQRGYYQATKQDSIFLDNSQTLKKTQKKTNFQEELAKQFTALGKTLGSTIKSEAVKIQLNTGPKVSGETPGSKITPKGGGPTVEGFAPGSKITGGVPPPPGPKVEGFAPALSRFSRKTNIHKPKVFSTRKERSSGVSLAPLDQKSRVKSLLISSNAVVGGGAPTPTNQNSGLALQTIWKKCNPGRWTSSLGCYSFFYNKFLNPKRYSIGRVGRLRLNKRLLRNPDCKVPTLTPEDILLAFNYLSQLRAADSIGNFVSTLELDDIDHLKNRRVRLPGEILQNQFRLALSRITYSALRFQDDSINEFPLENSTAKEKKLLNTAGDFARPPGNGTQKQKTKISPRSLTLNMPSPTCFGKPGGVERSSPPQTVGPSRKEKKFGLGAQPQTAGPGGGTPPSSFAPQVGSGSETHPRAFAAPPPIPAFQNTLRELFNTGQLSQYMDQTNPLAEITHKRRLSSLGPGGVGRDQAGFAVREIHPSHFGRICPIETPEGQNAGLVGSLASYARINADGFLQSPGLPIEQKKVHNRTGRSKIALFSSELEDEIYVCTGDTLNPSISNEPKLPDIGPSFPAFFPVRYKQEFLNLKGTEALELISGPTKLFTGVCPIQLISIATSLIPFLEHDDANRALMGSNMQRQAVPFMITEKPFVGTGLELQAARDSSTILLAKQSGQVVFVDASCIKIQVLQYSKEGEGPKVKGSAPEAKGIGLGLDWTSPPQGSSHLVKLENTWKEKDVFSYDLASFVPSNQSTSLRQRPAVEVGEWVEKGFLLADGSATKDGEVSLGKNVLLAYMPWEGYNFEDAIVINERLVFEDIYTSIHVERFEVDVKNTKILSFRNLEPGGASPERSSPESVTSQQQRMHSENQYSNSSFEGANSTRGNPLNSLISSKGSIPPGEYLTGDLDILMGRFDGIQASKNEKESGVSSKRTNPENSEFFLRPKSLSHLDERGVVKPGTWVQEGDILIGKVQIGTKELQQTSVTAEGLTAYGNLNEKIGNSTGTTSSKALPFPEYRLLLAIFDLQNNGSTTTKSGVPPYEKNKGPQIGDQLITGGLRPGEANEREGGRAKPPGEEHSNIIGSQLASTVTPTSNIILPVSRATVIPIISDYPIKNTSFKAGIGVKGRVLECILDGELFNYPEVRGPKVESFAPTSQKNNLKLLQTKAAKENKVNLKRNSNEKIKTENDLISLFENPQEPASSVPEGAEPPQATSPRVGLGSEAPPESFAPPPKGETAGPGVKPQTAGPSPTGRVELATQPSETLTNSDIRVFNASSKPKTLSRKTILDSGKEMCSTISIFLAHKKRIQLGDKMSGRHGNKGIVSLILPPQDMPYLQDGKPIDVVLNPLGVPSRMNVGQVLETLFGLSAFYSKKEYRIMPFDERINPQIGNLGGAGGEAHPRTPFPSPDQTKVSVGVGLPPPTTQSFQKVETSRSLVYGHLKHLRQTIQNGVIAPRSSLTFDRNEVSSLLKGNQLNWLFDPNNPGKTQVFDGRTGEIFYQPVLVGYSYMFKLIHLVDDKIHARSTGPYSLVTQQPLGGRSKKGGQRLGEMEVWALQGFGSASILQEFLTVKSDEIYSRNHFLFHLMRRNWSSLEKITFNKGFEKESHTKEPKNQSSFGAAPAQSNIFEDLGGPQTKQTGFDSSLSAPSKLPESFRVLVNELHALCLSVYSNLPN